MTVERVGGCPFAGGRTFEGFRDGVGASWKLSAIVSSCCRMMRAVGMEDKEIRESVKVTAHIGIAVIVLAVLLCPPVLLI